MNRLGRSKPLGPRGFFMQKCWEYFVILCGELVRPRKYIKQCEGFGSASLAVASDGYVMEPMALQFDLSTSFSKAA
jgi:hypothetical protein